MSYCKLFVHAFTAVALFDLAYSQLLKAAVEAYYINHSKKEDEPTVIILSDCCGRKTVEKDRDEKDEVGEAETESKFEL